MKKETHNPKQLHHHPAYSRAISIENPGHMHFIAGCTAADENYKPLHIGDVVKQYYEIMDQLGSILKSCGATWVSAMTSCSMFFGTHTPRCGGTTQYLLGLITRIQPLVAYV